MFSIKTKLSLFFLITLMTSSTMSPVSAQYPNWLEYSTREYGFDNGIYRGCSVFFSDGDYDVRKIEDATTFFFNQVRKYVEYGLMSNNKYQQLVDIYYSEQKRGLQRVQNRPNRNECQRKRRFLNDDIEAFNRIGIELYERIPGYLRRRR